MISYVRGEEMERANKLLKTCKKQGISLCRLAEMTGISIKTIYHYSIDDRFPRIKHRLTIAEALGVDWHEIFDEEKYYKMKEE